MIKYTSSDKQPKFTVIVSVKVSKRAVDRNRLKRVTRETLRINIKYIKPGNYALILKPKSLALTAEEYRAELLKAFKASKYFSK